jgi:hypothetical protein
MSVYVINDLDTFKEHSRTARCKLWRKVLTAEGIEVRMKAGMLGFRKVFESEDDPEFRKIKEFVEREGFIEVVDTVPDDVFFI